jgi:teichuronic acid biosynthesis glycosyltransferase TuaH
VNLIVFGFNDWHEWVENGFCTRSAITTLRLSRHPRIEKVLVVSSPSSIWINALRTVRAGAGQAHSGTTLRPFAVQQVASSVWVLDHARLMPREDTYPALYAANGWLHDGSLRRSVMRAADRLGMHRPVLWVANPLMAKHIGRLGESLSVFDAIDDWSAHPQKSRMRRPILEGYDAVRTRADIIFTVSADLAERLGMGRGGVHRVPNGVDAGRFERPATVPSEIEHLPAPRVGYVGTLQERVDTRMIAATARRLPTASIILAGPVTAPAHFESLRGLANVHFLGPWPSARVPDLVNSLDVCLLPHEAGAFTRSMDPMKTYEYLAAGKPVVASGPMDAALGEFVHHAPSPEAFARAVEHAASENDPDLAERRRGYARSRSWDRVVQEMVSTMDAGRAARAERVSVR